MSEPTREDVAEALRALSRIHEYAITQLSGLTIYEDLVRDAEGIKHVLEACLDG